MSSGPAFFGSAAAKAYSEGTTRTRDPARTLALLMPVLERFQITRLANVTGLDRVGIPVYQAIRPNGRSLAVSQGKGLDAVSAKVSALMESLETWHAEHTRCPVRLESHRALSREARVADPMRLPLSRTTCYHPETPLPWTVGRDVVSGEAVFVPFEMVHTNYTIPRVPGSGAFSPSTSGLGAGNHIAEAVLHGACELIERDAETLWYLGGDKAFGRTRVDPGTVNAPAARRLVDTLADAAMEVLIWDMTSDVGVASFGAFLFDPESRAHLNPYPLAYGSGCHPDREIALCRALTEAAQCRLTMIAGSRDDLPASDRRDLAFDRGMAHRQRLLRAPAERSFDDVPHAFGESIDDDLAHVAGCLAARGMKEVIVVDLSSPDLDLSFARTLIPGLEGSIEWPSYLPRVRAMEKLA